MGVLKYLEFFKKKKKKKKQWISPISKNECELKRFKKPINFFKTFKKRAIPKSIWQ